MIEVEMSKDIRSFETKFLGPFTFRQTISISLSCLYGIPFAIFCTPLEIMDRILVAFLLMIPVMACGWLKLDGMHFEIYMIRFVYWYLLTPKRRKYKTQNLYRKSLLEIEKKAEQEKIEQLSPKERNAYYKQLNKKKEMDYKNCSNKVYT